MTLDPLILAALRGDRPAACVRPDGTVHGGTPLPAAVLSGSFNPLHRGHLALAAAAVRVLGVEVAFELSAANVDKPDLSAGDLARRVGAFAGVGSVWVTRAATFERKAEVFPGAAFVVGHDTAVRLIDPRYYGGDPARRDAVLAKLAAGGCRVVVGGRVDRDGVFRAWESAALPGLFIPLCEAEFRVDLSSTELRS